MPYKEIVNWCARSTFYSEKAAWKVAKALCTKFESWISGTVGNLSDC